MQLSDLKVKLAKPQEKIYRLFDGRGLYLEVNPNGGKYWRFKYTFLGKERRLSLGVYPDIGLADAREYREAARKLVAKGIDPFEQRKAERISRAGGDSFEAIAREWHARNIHTWTPKHADTILKRLEMNVFPWLGGKPIDHIKAPMVLEVLRRMESRGALETAHRVRTICSQVFRYAVATGRLEHDVTIYLKGAISPPIRQHFPTILNPDEIGGLLRAIDVYEGSFAVKCALQLAPLLFVRPGELRHAEWKEFDFAKAEWRIPAEKMKMRVPHLVPLPRQAIAILKELEPLTNYGSLARYLFPSIRSMLKPMSDNTLLAALRRMGYEKDVIVTHGFRAMASSLLNEQGWNRDAIERQLSHGEKNKVRAAYNHAQYLDERRKMMQAWADYLDELKGKKS